MKSDKDITKNKKGEVFLRHSVYALPLLNEYVPHCYTVSRKKLCKNKCVSEL